MYTDELCSEWGSLCDMVEFMYTSCNDHLTGLHRSPTDPSKKSRAFRLISIQAGNPIFKQIFHFHFIKYLNAKMHIKANDLYKNIKTEIYIRTQCIFHEIILM